MIVLLKASQLRKDAVNVLDFVNLLENVLDSVNMLENVFDSLNAFDCANVIVGIGVHPSIALSLLIPKYL